MRGLTIVAVRIRDRIVRAFINVSGLTDERAAALEQVLTRIEGVVGAEVFADDAVASILYDVRADLPTLVAAIKHAGYDAQPL